MENKVINKNWDLSKVSNDLSLEELIDSWKAAAITECNLRKNAFSSLQNFKKWWFAYLKIKSIDAKVTTVYREFENLQNPTDEQKDWLAEANRADEEIIERNKHLPKISKMFIKNKKKVLDFINNDADLKKYKTTIQIDWLSGADHEMSDESKKMRNETWGVNPVRRIYEALKADTREDPIKDWNGRTIKEAKVWGDVTNSWSEVVRKNAYISMHTLERKHRETLLWIAHVAVSRANQTAKYCNYVSWVEQSIFENYQIPVKKFYYMIDQCIKFAPIHIKFNSYNRKLVTGVFGIDDPKPWDDDLIIQNTTDLITMQQAQDSIKEALSCLGQDYVQKIDECYKHNIIKWDKKRVEGSGYCFSGNGHLDEHPIRFNWDGTSISATTLAHELGHNINKKYIKANNEINTLSNSLLCEIASIVNSILMNLYFIKKFKANGAPKEQIYRMYVNLLDYLFGNISKNGFKMQMADRAGWDLLRAEKPKPYDFEMKCYKLKKAYWGLSKTEYNNIKKDFPYWLDVLRCYQPFINTVLDGIDTLQYYIGSIVALVVADKILKGDKKMLENYKKYLKSGTTVDQIKLLKTTLGLDLNKPKVYTDAKKALNKIVNDFIKDIKI